MAINFIGSKRSLIPAIEAVLDKVVLNPSVLTIDAFSGSGVVSRLLKQRGYRVIANDWQFFSMTLVSAALMHTDFPVFDGRCLGASSGMVSAEEVLAYLNALPLQTGLFVEAYGQGGEAGRLYFSRENAMKIQMIRDQIQIWRDALYIDDIAYWWLIAVLIEAADAVANTASVYGAYLKALKPSAQLTLILKSIYPTPGLSSGHEVVCEDAGSTLARFCSQDIQLIYVDPPYNERQYSANYHILETIARWDLASFIPRGKTGLRPQQQQRSRYCLGRGVRPAFSELFRAACPQYWLVSYSNEGLLTKPELIATMPEQYHLVADKEIVYPRFRADRISEKRQYLASSTYEYLLLFQKK